MAIATINPATGEEELSFDAHDEEEVERRIAAAAAALPRLERTTFAERAAWMTRAAELLEEDREELAAMITAEMGRPIAAARAEIDKSARGLRFYAEHAEAMLADEELADPGSVGASRAGTRYAPLGVILAVMPWNYPFWQVLRFAAPALMAGNAGLLKHASNVPQAAVYLDTLFERAGFPTGAFGALLIPAARVEAVLRDPRIAAATLTGSEPAGRALAAAAGDEIKHVVLELGGSDPFIVLPGADVDRAAETAAAARFQNTGQSCIAAKRFIVHDEVYDRFRERFVAAVGALRLGDPRDESTQVGPLATESGRRDIAELVDDAVGKGARVLAGGRAVDGPGWFYEPTVLEGVDASMRLHLEEAFGPVAVLYRAGGQDEALRLANGTPFGLSASLWSDDEAEQDWFIRRLQSGAVFVNGMTASHPELPFGGVKRSGIGRELAAAGIREFCNLQTVWRA